MPSEKIALCLQCRNEFAEEEIANASCCPSCGDTGIPADPRDTAKLEITTHELRILTMWAHRWAEQCGVKETTVVDGIVNFLHKQGVVTPLTMEEEFFEIKKEFPDAELYDGLGNRIDKPEQ